ncbi:MAG: phosphatidate cytidylyltransferase [Patescibacteria group bacterium]
MTKRILSAIVGGAAYVALGFYGLPWLSAGFAALAMLGLLEFWRLCRARGLRLQPQVTAAVGLILFASLTVVLHGADAVTRVRQVEPLLAACLILLFLAGSTAEVLKGQVKEAVDASAVQLFAGVYTIFPMAYMIMLRALPGDAGLYYFFLLTVATWAGDSAAYFLGSTLGRHRLAPALSPRKTWEGSAAGLAASALAGAVYGLAWHRDPWPALALGLLVGLCGQLGDLFESLLKRDFGVKDSGFFLPGHGGVLDRFDSLFFAAPVIYYLAAYLAP